jgi:ABC-type branched-subunit amino acid transport system substrate-binding protein
MVAAVVLASACTPRNASSPSAGAAPTNGGSVAPGAVAGLAASNDAAGSTTGITNDAINVAFIGTDFGALASTGFVPDLGDQTKQVNAFVDDINARGGIDGRKINLDLKLLNLLNGADVLQSTCIEVTQEFKAAVVILAPSVIRELTRCLAVTNKTLTIHATGFDNDLYAESQGRLFTPNGMSIDRQMKGWADEMDKLGLLKDKKVGVVLGDQPSEFVAPINNTLVPELEKLGHKPAQVVSLPCASGTSTVCDQNDAAAQRLKDSGVDVVFMTLANTFGTGLVQAASNIGYHPKWVAEGNQATDTVSKFFDSVKQDWDGTVGVSFAYAQPSDDTQVATDCNQVVADRGGEHYAPGSDAYGFSASVCNTFRLLKLAADKVGQAPLNQGALIAGLEGIGSFDRAIGPDGTMSPTKHDGLDALFLCDYKADVGKCVRRPDAPFPVAA